MKPLLWKYGGQWHCQSMRLECLRMGVGLTADEAYRDWEAL